MNKCFKVVFSKARASHVVVSEVTSSVQTKSSKTMAAVATTILLAGMGLSGSVLAADGVPGNWSIGQTVESGGTIEPIINETFDITKDKSTGHSDYSQIFIAPKAELNVSNVNWTLGLKNKAKPENVDDYDAYFVATTYGSKLTLDGDTANISVTADQFSANHEQKGDNEVIALGFGNRGYFEEETNQNGAVLNLNAKQTKINVSTTVAEAPMISGITAEGWATVNVNGNVDIQVDTAANSLDSPLTDGIYLYGQATLNTAKDTTLKIRSEGTGEGVVLSADDDDKTTPNAGVNVGFVSEGGKIEANGSVDITSTANGGYASGLVLQGVAGDEGWIASNKDKITDYGSKAVFKGDLSINASSKTGRVEGIRIGGFVPFDSEKPNNGGSYMDKYQKEHRVELETYGKTTIKASDSSDKVESVGIYFALPEGMSVGDQYADTNLGKLTNSGVMTVEGEQAVAGEAGDFINKGTLTLKGNVDAFHGTFTQEAGKTVVNAPNKNFFTTNVSLTAGDIDATDHTWTGNSADKKLSVTGGNLKLGAMHIQAKDALAFNGGTITITGSPKKGGDRSLLVDENVSVQASGDAKLVVKNTHYDSQEGAEFAKIKGQLTGLKSLDISIGEEDDFQVKRSGVLGVTGDASISGGTLDVVEQAKVKVGGKLTFKDKALLSLGDLTSDHIEAGSIVFEEGTSIYAPEATEDKTLTIKGWKAAFNGNVNLFTGRAKDGEDMDEEHALKIENLVAAHNAELTINGGSYAFKKLEASSGNIVLEAGEVSAEKLVFGQGDGKFTLNGGTLKTATDQLFTKGVGADGKIHEPEGLLQKDRMNFTKGTLSFTDKYYNGLYKKAAGDLVGSEMTVVFNGDRVDLEGDIDLDKMDDQKGVVEDKVNVTVSSKDGISNVDKSIGVSSITADDNATSVAIAADKEVTLVGSTEGKEVITFKKEGGNVDVKGTLALGQEGSSQNKGKLSAPVTVAEKGKLAVNAGEFTVAEATVNKGGAVEVTNGTTTFDKLTATDATIKASGGDTTVKALTVGGKTTIASGDKAVKVNSLALGGADNAITITGLVDVDSYADQVDGSKTKVLIGTTGKDGVLGDLTIKGDTLAKATYFLDPAFKDGVEQGSSLKFAGTTVDGKLVAGQNSYVVLGSTDDQPLLDVFNKGKLAWGDKDGQVGAAIYAAQPIKVADNGAIYADATLTALPQTIDDGSVFFAANSALVADVSKLGEDGVMITASDASKVTVEKGSKAVLIGDLKQNKGYQLTNNAEQNKNWSDNLISGNALWKLTMDDEGKINAKLQDASKIYGKAMQGTALANAGMQANGAPYDYVNSLLTDASGNISNLPSVAERFDATMNPAGALTAFTTAYDRASDLRRVVREESVKGTGNRLWAQLTGGKTKLDGISTGGRALDTETDAYGVAVGGEVELNHYTMGAAFTAGTGRTDNDAVDGRDDFDFYGLSLYGKTTVAGFDLLGDVSATWLKSDFTIGGAADVDTDTTTAVYSLGVQGEKTYELSWANVTPFVGMDLYHVRSNGFNNGHGAKVEDSNATAVELPIGARLAKGFNTANGFSVTPSFMLAVVPTLGDKEIDSKVRFAGASSTYQYTFTDDVKIRSNVGVDAVKDNFAFGLHAGYEWGNEERNAMNLQLRAKYAF